MDGTTTLYAALMSQQADPHPLWHGHSLRHAAATAEHIQACA
jgi:hypothetical protein